MDLSPDLLQSILNGINDGVYFVDPRRRITYWNHAAERITGYPGERVIGQLCMANILMHVNQAGEQLCLGACPLAQTLKDGQPRTAEVFLHHAEGHRVPVSVRVAPIAADGAITGAVEIFTENVTLASALARIEELQKIALLDDLTGIGNRRMVQLRLDLAMRDWELHSIPFGVLMIDIDHFKEVNDRFGHESGDRALKMVAHSLASGLRSYDFLGRWGGDEFLAVITNVTLPEMGVVAERMRMLVENSLIFLDEDNRSPQQAVKVTVSMGGALIQPGEGLEQVQERADAELYAGKGSGRNTVKLASLE